MKKYVKFGLAAVAFVVFLAGVSLLYNKLSAEYKPEQNLVVESGQENSAGAGEAGTETDAAGDDVTGENSATGDKANGDSNTAGDSDSVGTTSAEGSIAGDTSGEDSTTGNANAGAESNGTAADDHTAEEEQSTLVIDFTMENAAGESVALFDYIGKPIVLNFWASWCGPCKAEIPDFQEAYEKYEGEIEFLMVNMTDGAQETKESAMTFIEEQGYTLPFYFDTQLQGAYTYGVYSLPTTFFINAEGEVIAYAQGMIDAETLETGISMIYEEE